MTLPYSTQAGKIAYQEATALWRAINFRAGDFKALRGLQGKIGEVKSIATGARAATNQISEKYKKLEFDIKDGKKVTDGLKSGNWKSIGGKFASFMNLAFTALGVFGAIMGVANSFATQDLSRINLRQLEVQGREFTNQYRLIEKTVRGLRNTSQTVDKLVKEQKDFIDRTYAEATKSNRGAIEARQLANDALYEVRQGRKIVEQRISTEIQKANTRIAEINTRVNNALGNATNNTIDLLKNTITKLQDSLSQSNRNIERLSTKVDKAETITKAIPSVIQRTVTISQDTTKKAVDSAFDTLQQVNKRWGVTVTPSTITPAQVTVSESLGLSVTPATVTPARVTFSDFSTSDLGLQLKVNQERQQSNINSQLSALGSAISNVGNAATTANYKADLALKEARNKGVVDLTPINTKIREIERVNEEGNRKLDQILPKINSLIPTIAGIPLIAARATADAIRPDIPTISGIEAATGRAMCRNLQTGCGRQAIDDAVGNVTNNVNQHNTNNTGSILDAINTGANAALLNGQQTILARLGDQLPGGIGGKLSRVGQWLQLDRLLNILTFITTVHNAMQLTSDIALTLGQAIANGLALIGIKDDSGSPIDIGQMINSTVENLVKGIVGAENYQQISSAWQKANRIYQASANVLNSLMNVNSVITNALEVVGGYTGRIGNALRIWGVVGEKAYSWMNPQPNFDNKWITKLQQLQEGANTVAMVAQIPVDVANSLTDLGNSSTEFVNAIKQEPGTTPGLDVGEAANVKAEREAAKAVSASLNFDISDLFDADE